jgi:outer membrane protein
MKNTDRSFVVKKHTLALFAAALVAGSIAAAQSQPPASSAPAAGTPAAHIPSKVGVIQIQAAIVSTREGQKATQEFQSKLEPRKKELDRKAGEIRDLQDKLARGGNAMAESAKTDLTRTIDAKTKSYNRDMEDAQAEADADQRKMVDELGQKMMQVIDRYAQANGYSVILDVSNPQTPVLYASNQIDVTKDIIELYDKSTPTAGTTTSAPKPPASTPPAPKPAATTPPAVKKQP